MNHEQLYAQAYFYDLLFRFKEIEQENQTLISLYEDLNQKKPNSFVDIAAGPADNAIGMKKIGLKSYAIDFSPEMVAYGLAKAKKAHQDITYIQADMRDFQLPEKVDIAAIFTISTCYLLTNQDMLQHLRTVANQLNPQGIYVLEMPHPMDAFAIGHNMISKWESFSGEKWENRWEEEWDATEGDTHVSIQWGNRNDEFDPITQIRKVTARLSYKTPEGSGEVVEQQPQREYTFQEMKALIELSGVFSLEKCLGTWDINVPFSNDKESWRMILVLRKK